MRELIYLVLILFFATDACKADGNRFAYLDEVCAPYYVHQKFPKLTTPQWVGEEGVECVVVLAIDDMRDPPRYEAYLRPILDRLKKIDGRAPVSIMTCSVDPQDPQLQVWLNEGLSIECHTVDHPCPLLQGSDFAKAKSTYDRCVDMMNEIPGNKPVAFRMPCCDSKNTPSPRFWKEIFSHPTDQGNRLSIDSSVFCVLTPKDESLPRELVVDPDGGERFRKYIPFPSFVNTIEDYPYPYIIGGTCWEFPCIVPSDWEAQNLQKPNNPRTVADMKAALDAVVLKQGVFNLVFHPHGWIRAEQVVELIDHAVEKHGTKVKFLTFREAHERLKSNLMNGKELGGYGSDQGLRLLDVNRDGYVDVIDGGAIGSGDGKNMQIPQTRIWLPQERQWRETNFPSGLVVQLAHNTADLGAKFGVLAPNGDPCVLIHHAFGTFTTPHPVTGLWAFDGESWVRASTDGLGTGDSFAIPELCEGTVFRDLDGDGCSELIVGPPQQRGKFNTKSGKSQAVYKFEPGEKKWGKLPFTLPDGISLAPPKDQVGPLAPDGGVRLVDINGDGVCDVLVSNPQRSAIWLFKSMTEGWNIQVFDQSREDPSAKGASIPMLVRPDGTNNGAWFHSSHLWIQNEDTARLPDGVDRRSYTELLGAAAGKSP